MAFRRKRRFGRGRRRTSRSLKKRPRSIFAKKIGRRNR